MELWTLPAIISEVSVEERWELEYVNDGEGGTTTSSRFWEEIDEFKVSEVEIPYIGEEDEVNPEILVPAIEEFLKKKNFISSSSYIEEDRHGMSYTVYYDRSDQPYLRVTLG